MRLGKYLWLGGALVMICPNTPGQLLPCEKKESDSDRTVVYVAAGEDGSLMSTVQWSRDVWFDFVAEIRVLDRKEAEVARLVVEVKPGEIVTYRLTDGPGLFEEHGYWYRLQVRDFEGHALTADLPFLISLCPQESGCIYSVVPGFTASGLSMESELFRILDHLAAAGSRDLLADALRRRPDLESQVYWVADQLDHLLGPDRSDVCTCSWVGTHASDPSGWNHLQDPTGNAWERFHCEIPVSGHLSGQIEAYDPMTLSRRFDGQVGLHLRCHTISFTERGEWSGQTVELPTLAPCERDCSDAWIETKARLEGQAHANAWAATADGADSKVTVTVEIHGQTVFSPFGLLTAQAEVSGKLQQDLLRNEPPPVDVFAQTSRRDASYNITISSRVELGVDVARCPVRQDRLNLHRNPVCWAYGCATGSATVELFGTASCARTSEEHVVSGLGDPPISHDGLVLVPTYP